MSDNNTEYYQTEWQESHQEQWQTEEHWQEEVKDDKGQGKGNQKTNQKGKGKGESDFFFGLIIGFFKFIFESLTTAFELIIRKNFGERYFTPLKFLFGLIIIGNVAFGGIIADFSNMEVRYPSSSNLPGFSTQEPPTELFQQPFSDEQLEEYKETKSRGRFFYDLPNRPLFSATFFVVYIIAYILFGLGEFRRQFERARDGKPWHSYNTGQSRINFLDLIIKGLRLKSLVGKNLIANHLNQLYIEPLFYLCVGLAFMLFLPLVGGFITLGSILIFVRGQIIFHRVKKQILDIKDSKIESKFMAKAIKGADPNNTAGMTIMSIRPQFSSDGVGTAEAMGNAFASNPNLAKMAGIDFEDDTENLAPKKSKMDTQQAQKMGEELFEKMKKASLSNKSKTSPNKSKGKPQANSKKKANTNKSKKTNQ